MPVAIFRCDASAEIGGGHVRRCLALAAGLRDLGWATAFATIRESHAVIPWIPERERLDIAPNAIVDPAALRALRDSCDLLVVDHYGLGQDYEARCRGWARRILAIDDLARPHDCDALLDHNAGRDESDYDGLLPEGATILAGPGFALLDGAYAQARSQSLVDPATPRGLVSLGAGNTTDVVGRLLDFLPVDARIVAACGSISEQQARELKSHGSRLANVELAGLLEARVMAKLMQTCGWAIGAGGISALERCVLGLPSLAIEIAPNQRAGIAALVRSGAAIALGNAQDLTKQRLNEAMKAFDAACRRAMADAAATLCDGYGVRRVAAWLDRFTTDGKRGIVLRQARADDEEITFAWQSAPETRRYSRDPNPPGRDEHHAWFAARLRDRNCIFNMIAFEGKPAGVLRLDRREGEVHEVSINVAPELAGRGIASAALRLAARLLPGGRLGAAILPGNAASLRLFERAGFRPVRDGWYEMTCPQPAR